MKIIIGYILLLSFLCCKKLNSSTSQLIKRPSIISKDSTKKANEFKFSILLLNKDEEDRPSKLKIEIKRNNKIIQNIIFIPETWFSTKGSFKISRINYYENNTKIQEGVENYHDFIIDDFNFDNLEDFAILYDYGGNAGPIYSYYFKNCKGKFELVKDFPLNQDSFPKNVDTANRTLTTIRPFDCCKIETNIFHLKKNKSWELLSSKQEDMK